MFMFCLPFNALIARWICEISSNDLGNIGNITRRTRLALMAKDL